MLCTSFSIIGTADITMDTILTHNLLQDGLYHEALTNELMLLSCEKRVNRLMSNAITKQLRQANPFLFHMGKEESLLRFSGDFTSCKSFSEPYYTFSGRSSQVGFGSMKNRNPDHNLLRRKKIDWRDRYQMLVEYKKEHGHCMVPQSHPTLGAWVKWQREKFALHEGGKSKYFNEEKIDKLNEIGFVWRMRRRRKKRQCKDEEKYMESGECYERPSKHRKQETDEI